MTTAEFNTLRNKAILKLSEIGYQTVVEDIFKFRKSIQDSRLDLIWACVYVINLYDPAQGEDNYITEKQLLDIADYLQRA